MSLPVSPDEEGVMSDNAVPCGTTPSCVNAVSSISEASGKKKHLALRDRSGRAGRWTGNCHREHAFILNTWCG